MRKLRLKKSILLKSTAFAMALCMIIGNTYIPAFAEEGDGSKTSALKNEDSTSDNLANQDTENKKEESSDSKDDTKAEDGTQDEKKPETGDAGEKKPETNNNNTEGKEPSSDDNIGKENQNSDEGSDEKELEKEESTDGEESEEPETDDEKFSDDIEAKESEEKESGEEWKASEIINVLVPSAYLLALNPYSLPIKIGEDEITTEQVISGNYGIVNKSSTDQIVTVSLTVEDMNDGELVFVDSAEEAWNAEEGVYAVYLAVVPANEEEVLVNDLPIDENITGEALQNVKMTGALEQAAALYAGENEIAFKLSKATYYIEDVVEITEDNLEKEPKIEKEPEMNFGGLAPKGKGVTAYSFYGAMNPNAPWEKLSGGIRLSVVYTYQTADGSEKIIEGTGAVVSID